MLMAIKHYIEGHMALDMNHENIKISKIACAAFVLGSEGKMKLFAPQPTSAEASEENTMVEATGAFVQRLVAAATLKELTSAG